MKNIWDKIKNDFHKSPNSIKIVEINSDIPCNTALDAVVNNSSIITVNKYLRLLCSGDSDCENIINFNSKFKHVVGENKYAIAHDVWGGIFALTKSGTQYFSPDTLQWEDLGISYEGFLKWISTTDITEFYTSFIWVGFDKYVDAVSSDSGVMIYPFLWAKECDVETSSKKIVPFHELINIVYEVEHGFG